MIHFLLIILLVIYGVQGSDPTIKAEPGAFKYLVMIWYQDEFHCGGTIIDQRHIITRGTCVMDIPSANLSIVTGIINPKFPEIRTLQIESIHIHYGFKVIDEAVMLDERHWVHDIAILKLVNRMVWDALTTPAVLITGKYNWKLAFKCVVPAWRHACIGTNRESYYIRWIGGNIGTDAQCNDSNVLLLKNEKCALWNSITEPWTHTMHYYIGSPIVCENTVVGIVNGREKGRSHAFLNLLPYKDFIENVIDDRKYDVNPGEINYVVTVWYQGLFKCGGIIFGASHILTTGDCVQYANETYLQVIAGHTQVVANDPRIQWLSVVKIEIHPDYREFIHFDGPKFMHVKNNYAILTLAVPLEWGPTIGPAFLSNTHFFPTNYVCGAYRWHNAYTVDDQALLQLIWSREVIMNAEACHGAGVDLEADEICVSSQYAQHPKNLDSSGNPVVCDEFVIGIIIPNYSTDLQFSCLTSILSISPFVNSLSGPCYSPPMHQSVALSEFVPH